MAEGKQRRERKRPIQVKNMATAGGEFGFLIISKKVKKKIISVKIIND